MAQVPSGVERGGNAAACIREGAKDPKLTPSEPNPKHEAPPWRDSTVTSHRPLEPIRVMISRGSEVSRVICATIKQSYNRGCAIAHLMVTQITLNTEPHGFDSCQGHSTEKLLNTRRLIRSPWPGVVEGGPTTELVKRSPPASSHGVVRSRTARLKGCDWSA